MGPHRCGGIHGHFAIRPRGAGAGTHGHHRPDGTRGLPDRAPFDAINVAAAGSVEALAELEAQLAPGGRLIAPITEPLQRLSLTRRTSAGLERELLEEVRFVPLVRDD